jgi:hypothetical protein
MIPLFCTAPTCPILPHCQRKFDSPQSCLHRPAPFTVLDIPENVSNISLSRMFREEAAMRDSAIDNKGGP